MMKTQPNRNPEMTRIVQQSSQQRITFSINISVRERPICLKRSLYEEFEKHLMDFIASVSPTHRSDCITKPHLKSIFDNQVGGNVGDGVTYQ